jgi:hypothetical protein
MVVVQATAIIATIMTAASSTAPVTTRIQMDVAPATAIFPTIGIAAMNADAFHFRMDVVPTIAQLKTIPIAA